MESPGCGSRGSLSSDLTHRLAGSESGPAARPGPGNLRASAVRPPLPTMSILRLWLRSDTTIRVLSEFVK